MTRLRLRILASFGVAILVIVTGWVGAAALSVGINARDQGGHSRVAVEAIRALQRNLLEAEAAVHAYVLTGDPAYVDTYVEATRSTEAAATLRGKGAELGAVAQGLTDRRALLDRAMRLAGAGDVVGATAVIADARARLTGQQLARRLDELAAAESQRRDDLNARVRRALRIGRTVIFAGMLLAFALAVVVNVSLMRAVRDREAWQGVVESQALQLERHTASLLDHERHLGEQLLAQQRLATALQRSNEELDQFAYATSHDLKAPLRGIMNLAGWIEEDLGPDAPAEVRANLGLMRTRARRLEALIEGILAYARAGRVREKVERVDLRQLTRDVVELIAPPAGCEVIIGSSLPVLDTERVPLQQVLMNLIQNGIKHGCPDQRGVVEVVGEQRDGVWRITVRDHGPGIAPEFHQRIFGVFQTLAPRDKVEGTGIGLAVVKKLVETRGGALSVESEPGHGASFHFTWPTPP